MNDITVVLWKIKDDEQSRARLHRPGQTRSVTYLSLLATGTVDEQIAEALNAKRQVVEYAVDGLGKGRE